MFGLFLAGLFTSAVVGLMIYGVVASVNQTNEYAQTMADGLSIEDVTKEKRRLTSSDETIIGIVDPVLVEDSALTVSKFDTTTYPDRAIIQLTNGTAGNVTLYGASIRGKLVVKSAGANGYVWEYSDYDGIEKNGEAFFEVSNDFMFDPGQVEAVGDYCWKVLKPHAVYSLSLVGCQHQFEIGDFYTLNVVYQLGGASSEIENVDVSVEVMGVSFNRQVGGVGQTVLTVRKAIGTWNKTTSKRAKLVGAGKSQWLNNRSNVVTVASSTWTGQADYFCDGTDDDVEIQAAIDYLSSIGGGRVDLTSGDFYLSENISLRSNVSINGSGPPSVLWYFGIYCYRIDNFSISNLSIYGGDNYGIYCDIRSFTVISAIYNVTIYGLFNDDPLDGDVWGIKCGDSTYRAVLVKDCNIYDLYGENVACGIDSAFMVTNTTIQNVVCNAYPANGIGILDSTKCQQNIVTGTVTKYSGSYADSGSVNACADTAAGGYNS